MKEKGSEESATEGRMLRSVASPGMSNGERSSRRLKRRASLGSTEDVEEEEEERGEGNADTLLASRPKRNIISKNLDFAAGLSWKEENDLKKALYASLQESKKREADGLFPPPAMVSRPPAGKSGLKRSHSWTPKGTDESSQDSLSGYPNYDPNAEKDPLSKAKVHAQRKFAQGSRPNSPNVTPIKVKPQTPRKFFTTKKAKTEDFLTFLCLRGTHLLPPHMDFYNMEDSDENGSSAPGTPRQSSTGSRPGTPGLLGRFVGYGPVTSRQSSPDRDISSFSHELGVRPLSDFDKDEATDGSPAKKQKVMRMPPRKKKQRPVAKTKPSRITCPFLFEDIKTVDGRDINLKMEETNDRDSEQFGELYVDIDEEIEEIILMSQVGALDELDHSGLVLSDECFEEGGSQETVVSKSYAEKVKMPKRDTGKNMKKKKSLKSTESGRDGKMRDMKCVSRPSDNVKTKNTGAESKKRKASNSQGSKRISMKITKTMKKKADKMTKNLTAKRRKGGTKVNGEALAEKVVGKKTVAKKGENGKKVVKRKYVRKVHVTTAEEKCKKYTKTVTTEIGKEEIIDVRDAETAVGNCTGGQTLEEKVVEMGERVEQLNILTEAANTKRGKVDFPDREAVGEVIQEKVDLKKTESVGDVINTEDEKQENINVCERKIEGYGSQEESFNDEKESSMDQEPLEELSTRAKHFERSDFHVFPKPRTLRSNSVAKVSASKAEEKEVNVSMKEGQDIAQLERDTEVNHEQ